MSSLKQQLSLLLLEQKSVVAEKERIKFNYFSDSKLNKLESNKLKLKINNVNRKISTEEKAKEK